MKIRLVGGPIPATQKVECELDEASPLQASMSAVQTAAGSNLAGYVLHSTEVEGKKVKAGPALAMEKVPAAAGLKAGAIVMIKKAGGSQPSTPRDAVPEASPDASPRGASSYRDRVLAMYEKYDPGKINQVDPLLKKHAGKEEQVIASLVKKYGPEPASKPPVESSPTAPNVPHLNIDKATPTKPEKSYRDRLVAIFERYEPSKVGQVDGLLKKHAGKEEQVIAQLVKKFGPEPDQGGTPSATTPSTTARSEVASPRVQRSYKERIVAIFQQYDPAKVGQADALLKKHAGKEESVIAQLVRKYGPEPAVPQDEALATPKRKPVKSYKDRVIAIYKKYEPSKLSTVDRTMEKFKGQEEEVMKTLITKYGPEPVDDEEDDTVKQEAPAREPTPSPVASPAPPDVSPVPATPPEDQSRVEEAIVMTPGDTPRGEEPLPANDVAVPRSIPMPMPALKPARDRTRLIALAVSAFSQTIQKGIASDYFLSWQQFSEERSIQKSIEGALSRGIWKEAGDGQHVPVEGGDAVQLTEEYRRRKALVPQPQVIQKKVRQIRIAIPSVKPFPESHFLTADDVVATFDLLLTHAESINAELQSATQRHQREDEAMQRQLQELKAHHSHLETLISEAEAKAARFEELEALVRQGETARTELESLLQQEAVSHAKTREQLVSVRSALKKERQGVPTDVEKRLAERDETIARLQREQAKLRTQVRQEKAKSDRLSTELEERQKKIEKLGRSPSRGMSSTNYKSPALRSASREQNRLALTESSPKDDAEYFPDESPNPGKVEIEGSETSSLDDDVVAIAPTVNRGECPNCFTNLTSFGENAPLDSLPDSARVAFCFSCRRSFTARDLKARDQRMSSRDKILSKYSSAVRTR